MAVENRWALPWQQIGSSVMVLPVQRTGGAAGAVRDTSAGNVGAGLVFRGYVGAIVLVGATLAVLAVLSLPARYGGLLLFMGLAGLSELMAVELFRTNKTRVSVSAVVATAAMVVVAPLAGVVIYLASGLASVITILASQKTRGGRILALRRSAFDLGMAVISTAAAGQIYALLGSRADLLARSSNAFPFIIGVGAGVLVHTALVIGDVALRTGRHPIAIWTDDVRWGIPGSILGGVIGGGGLALAFQMYGMLGMGVFCLPVISTTYSYRMYVASIKGHVNKLEEVNRSLDEANLGLLETLGAVMDAYDVYTYGHSTQVAVYAGAIAEELGIPHEEREVIVRAALVHDIGKIGILDSIIGKQGPLTHQEFNIVKRHPLLSAEIVGRMKALRSLAPLVRGHHERWDGTGYPDGLKGEEIPLGVRVLGLADALDALCSDRPYRPTHSLGEVVVEVKRCSGQHFDPNVVAAFLRVAEKKDRGFFVNSAVSVDHLLSNGTVGTAMRHARYLKKGMMCDEGLYYQ